MARILDCWELGNGLAYIEGLSVGSKMLRKAGHEVMFAGRDLSHAERLFGDKIPYYQAPTQVAPPPQQLANPMTFADVLINLGFISPAAVTARVRAWRHLIDLLKPDLIRCANAPGALLAARGTGVRSLVFGIGFIVPPPASPLPLIRTWAKDYKLERMAEREQRVLAAMNQGLDAVGAPRLQSVAGLYTEADARLLYTFPDLDDYGPRQDVRYMGNFQSAQGDKPAWPDVPGKRIFAYLEPHKPIADILQALADTRQPVLVYMAHPPAELLQRYGSGNLRITDQPLDLMETAARCDLGVSHGGHNIVATLLWSGKPQLCIPTLFPERVTAERVERLGAGICSRMEPGVFATDLARLLQDQAFAAQARAAAERAAPLGMEAGLKEFMTIIQTMLESGPRHWP